MTEFLQRILDVMSDVSDIPLQNGNSYTYIGTTTTRMEGQTFQAFSYEISPNNQKRVSLNLIHKMYLETLRTNTIPSRAAMFELFRFELSSRPCNYTVASFIVSQLIENN